MVSLLCLLGRHERSRTKAREVGTNYVSVCRRCGTPMKRLPSRKWVPSKPDS